VKSECDVKVKGLSLAEIVNKNRIASERQPARKISLGIRPMQVKEKVNFNDKMK